VCLRACLSVCTALLKKVVSPSDCKITKLISLAQAVNVGNAAIWDGLINRILESEFKLTWNICNVGTLLISASANLPVGQHLNGHVATEPQELSK